MPEVRLSDFTEVDPLDDDQVLALQIGEPVLLNVGGLASTYQVNRSVTLRQTTTSATAAPVTELSSIALPAGYWLVEGVVVWQSSALTTGMEMYFSVASGTCLLNANWWYQSTATTGVSNGIVDGATSGNQVVEGRAQRNSAAPGPTAGVDTADTDVMYIVHAILRASTAFTMNTLFRSEVEGSQVAVEVGSGLLFTRYKEL